MPENIAQSVGGKFVRVSATFARPANTTAYAAGDVVSNSASATVLLAFPLVVRSIGGSGAIIKARIETDKKDEIGQYRLVLYTKPETTVTVPVDNAADTSLYANRSYRIGYIDFPALTAGADTANNTAAIGLWTGGVGSATAPSGPLAFVTDATPLTGETAIYGKLVNITGTTPASGQNFYVELTILQN